MAGGIYDESGTLHPHSTTDRSTTATTEHRILADRQERMLNQIRGKLFAEKNQKMVHYYMGMLTGMRTAMELVNQHLAGTEYGS